MTGWHEYYDGSLIYLTGPYGPCRHRMLKKSSKGEWLPWTLHNKDIGRPLAGPVFPHYDMHPLQTLPTCKD